MFKIKFLSLALVLCFYSVAFGGKTKDPKSNLPDRTVCGKQIVEDRIFGGEETSLGEFPWVALLGEKFSSGKFDFSCGGSLINDRYVVTAAHCIGDDLTTVRLGEHDIDKEEDCDDSDPGLAVCSDKPVDIEIEEKIVHEKYDEETLVGDIALLRLKDTVKYNDYIRPICLPLSQELKNNRFIGKKVVTSGWGVTEKGWTSSVKLKVELPVVDNANCSESIKKHLDLTVVDSQLCAGGQKGKDSCQGDSGGPLMYSDKQVNTENFILCGVVSYGYKCGIENSPGVYTRVADYVEWILKNLKP